MCLKGSKSVSNMFKMFISYFYTFYGKNTYYVQIFKYVGADSTATLYYGLLVYYLLSAMVWQVFLKNLTMGKEKNIKTLICFTNCPDNFSTVTTDSIIPLT